MPYIIEADQFYSIPLDGRVETIPVHRIFCVGRNYTAHAVEMGVAADCKNSFYFTKSPSATKTGEPITYGRGSENYHHEVELAVTLGAGGVNIEKESARYCILADGVALDMTHRDLQAKAREQRRPWDLAKDGEQSAVFAPMLLSDEFIVDEFIVDTQKITLRVHVRGLNGELRQQGRLLHCIFSVEDLICDLSKYYRLRAGDIILTGTPAGVGPVSVGDGINAQIEGPPPLNVRVLAADT